MVNSNANALGIIFPNSYDNLVPQLVEERLMASIPFAGRYRMVDFILSSLVNCGIDNISVIVRENYHSLMDHLGTGRSWDLIRKNGGLNIVPPYAEKNVKVYTGRVEALASYLPYLQDQKEKYVIIADTNIAVNFDFTAMLDQHIKTGADVTVAYMRAEVPLKDSKLDYGKDFYYTLRMEDGRINKIYVNSKEAGLQNYCMNIYVIDRELLIDKINTAFVRGYSYFERDILSPHLDELKVYGFLFEGYAARITDMKSYFEENMKILDDDNREALFSGNPIYTKIRDDNPTRYINGAKGKNILVADGCVIEGEVENCVLFRGVRIGKGAKVKNCVLMQDTVIGEYAHVEYVITDKNVEIAPGREVKGTNDFQVYVEKHRNA